MELKQLDSFTAVVRLGSFTKAAETLYLSQPTISTHIRALEEELNTSLIRRTTKSIEVTAEGQKVYEYAVNILQLRDRMARECRGNSKRIIHLGASTIPSAYILPEILPAFGKRHDNTFFVIQQSDSQGVMDGLADGLFDVGLTGMACDREGFVCKDFCEDRMVLITPVSAQFLEMQAQGVTPMDILLSEPVILREKGSGSKKNVEKFLEQAGISEERLKVSARINDPEAIKNLVAGGLGVSVVSARAARNFLMEKRLLAFDLPDWADVRKLYVVTRTEGQDDPKIREFVDFVVEHYRAENL